MLGKAGLIHPGARVAPWRRSVEFPLPDVDDWEGPIVIVGIEKMYDLRSTYGILEEEVGETMTKRLGFDLAN